MAFRIKEGITVANTAFVDINRNITASSISLSGGITGPSELIVTPTAVPANSGVLRIKGNLVIDGDSVTFSSGGTAENLKNKGVANGYASLDSSGRVPASQLPSYVDEVLEYSTFANFPTEGESGKIYLDLSNGKIYRWSGSTYIRINDAVSTSDSATKLSTSRTISATGDASWTVSFDGSANATAALTLTPSGVTAGTYTKVTVNSKGLVTGSAALVASDIPSLDWSKITTGKPTTLAGYGITDGGQSTNAVLSGQTKFDAGTAAAPSISFITAPNVGVYLPNTTTLGFSVGGASAATMDNVGNFVATANVTAYSDDRLKDDWRVLSDNFVEQLASIKSGIFTRVDTNTMQVGVSAQSLREILPAAVIENTNGYLSVAYGNAALASCVELAKAVLKLQERIAELEATVQR